MMWGPIAVSSACIGRSFVWNGAVYLSMWLSDGFSEHLLFLAQTRPERTNIARAARGYSTSQAWLTGDSIPLGNLILPSLVQPSFHKGDALFLSIVCLYVVCL